MRIIIIICLLVFNAFLLPVSSWAGGIVYGEDHAFSFLTPDDWILDTKSGVSQGLPTVFYPRGYSWENSPVVMYARGVPRTASRQTIKAFVNETLESFKKYSPNITVRLFKVIKTEAECEAEVYLYKGDKWGNKELVAYYLEKKTINFFVLSARTEFAFNKATQPFLDLAKSYVFITDQVQIEESKE